MIPRRFHSSVSRWQEVIVADNLPAYYECGLGFVRQRENLFSCAVRQFYLLHSGFQRS